MSAAASRSRRGVREEEAPEPPRHSRSHRTRTGKPFPAGDPTAQGAIDNDPRVVKAGKTLLKDTDTYEVQDGGARLEVTQSHPNHIFENQKHQAAAEAAGHGGVDEPKNEDKK